MFITESDTRAKYIDPKLKESGWEEFVIREYYFTDGRKLLGGKRGKRLFADYLLRYKNTNLAIIEAKKLGKHPTEGLQQAIRYAEKLKVKYVFATNGEKIYQFDMNTGTGNYIDHFPSPETLFQQSIDNLTSLKKQLLDIPFYLTGDKQLRYYQEIAVNKAVEAIADDKKRILLTLATGTGKTFIAFQIVHKLLSVKWNLDKADRRPKILFLADRNVLADQAINTFNDPYEKDLIKIDGSEIKARNGVVPTNAFIFFAIYQAISEKENIGGYYKQYP
jgi:type I restriction enzyme, R subunit